MTDKIAELRTLMEPGNPFDPVIRLMADIIADQQAQLDAMPAKLDQPVTPEARETIERCIKHGYDPYEPDCQPEQTIAGMKVVVDDSVDDGLAVLKQDGRIVGAIELEPEQGQPKVTVRAANPEYVEKLNKALREQEQQEGWEIDYGCDTDCHSTQYNGRTVDLESAADLLNKAGITPDTSDDELEAVSHFLKLRRSMNDSRAKRKGQFPHPVAPEPEDADSEQEGWGVRFKGAVSYPLYDNMPTTIAMMAVFLNHANITPITPLDDLAAMARLKEMRDRGVELVEGKDLHEVNMVELWRLMRELLLGEGE